MKTPLYVLSLLALVACSGKEKPTRVTGTDSAKVAGVARSPQPAGTLPGKSVDTPDPSVGAGTWLYEKTIDKAGRTVYKASITSPNVLQFGFPYAGGSTATLTIRKRDSQMTVYLRVSKGQFNRSFQGGSARVRFDRNPPGTYSFSAAENGSANIIFFDSEQALIKKMSVSRKMIIDVEFYAQGRRQIEFRTANLKWSQ